tara:strand:+ start:6413 stop:8392 length:1980 start_codon:yes stop_codon:yes gene_type:complete
MANGPRSIYSRRQRMAPGQYDTPLADFLDALPGYVNQFQQNQLALERQQLADKRYEDSIKRQRDRDDYNKRKNTFDTNLNIVSQQGPQIVNRYLKTMSKDPKYSEFVTSDIESILSESIKNDDSLNNIEATYSDFTSMGQKELFSKTAELQGFRDTLDEEIKRVGIRSDYYKGLQGKRDAISKIINFNESKEGTDLPTEQWSASQISLFDNFQSELKKDYSSYIKVKEEFDREYRVQNEKDAFSGNADPIITSLRGIKTPGDKAGEGLFKSLKDARNRYILSKSKIENFTKNNKLLYPESQTREEIKARKELDSEKQKFIDDNASLFIEFYPSIDSIEDFANLLSGDDEQSDLAYQNLKNELPTLKTFSSEIESVSQMGDSDTEVSPSLAVKEEEDRDLVKKEANLFNRDDGISINRFSFDGQEAIIDYSQTRIIGPTGEKAYLVELEDGDQTYVPESSLPKDVVSGAKVNDQLVSLLDDMQLTARAKTQGESSAQNLATDDVDILPDQTIDPMFTDQTGLIPIPGSVGNLQSSPPSSIERIKSLKIKDDKGSNISLDSVASFDKQINSMLKRIKDSEVFRPKKFTTDYLQKTKNEQIRLYNDLLRLNTSIMALPRTKKNTALKQSMSNLINRMNSDIEIKRILDKASSGFMETRRNIK